ncbi:hypothetical protein Kpol_479p24 [Vanderwaltozyma polyspora DSM 70294]|uniref:Protein SKT5 n=1 Tax=Vanderwaltozyma polyspora (strain ATCC 22028 / DSM 70294 / BCRC 21397 / CBS 2163 / NBRC 10782 / NRRL Y-8283 / UCD 57-17) TaxID=436907 RepID=A7TQD7_VANPO|nr:uncharacterized protein Kpol_479p24 [Vanderwaltozyma polyspora DSM 70294]EDO15536.1 hypothetical protein Kpol_479p24 [Vanderwaltozyma polyspora DSM 70294]
MSLSTDNVLFNKSSEISPPGIHPYKKHLMDSQPQLTPASSEPTNSSSNLDLDPKLIKSDSREQLKIYGDMGPPSVSGRPSLMTSPEGSSSSLRSSNNSGSTLNFHKKRTKSVDLSHLYLLANTDNAEFTATNESVADMSHQMISQYLGEENNSSLLPRLKTIDMYRQNVKKSKDPSILFEYAQYILQTALTMEASNELVVQEEQSNEKTITQKELRKQFLKEAHHYLKKLSVKGYANAQYLLGDSYASGAFDKIENKEAFTLFQAAAKHGHIESAYRTAYCFENGLGTTRDSRRALDFLKFAASRNHPSSMFKLGLYSFYGRMGLPSDVNTKQNGIKWLSRASAIATELTCAAPYELAKIYENGFLDIIIRDEKYATELYIQAASLGHVPSATILGQIYERGNETVTQDTSLSVHYYTQAAMKGDPIAMLGLCAWYLLGAEPAFEKDENEAFQWASKAADIGLPKAQFIMGFFYEKGKGCVADLETAWGWYELAAKNNEPRAIKKLESRQGRTTNANGKIFTHKKNKSTATVNLFTKLEEEEDFREPETVEPEEYFSPTNDSNKNTLLSPTLMMKGSFEKTPTLLHDNANTQAYFNLNTENFNHSPPVFAAQFEKKIKAQMKNNNDISNSDKKTKKKSKKSKQCIIM